jgi:diaminopimelate decarboxylase
MSVRSATVPQNHTDPDPDPDPDPAGLIAARPMLSMHAMDGLLFSGVPLNAVADAVGTPVWVYAAPVMRARYRALRDALADAGGQGAGAAIHYAVKANDHLAVLDVFAREGAGADVVSGGELRRALRAGIPAARIVFSGVGKSPDELRLALAEDIAQINVESVEELAMLSAVAGAMGRTARVTLRVNPDVDAGTHAKIATGRAGDKFGIPHDAIVGAYAHASRLPHIRPIGLATHIGSQILTQAPYRAAYARLAGLVAALRQDGQAVQTVDCGGGLGVNYRDQTEGSPASRA